jgi:hypothetical protein
LNEEAISSLEKTLKYAKLTYANIKTSSNNNVIVDTNVEIVCYDNASNSGDWATGKSISEKSFELKKING